MPYFGDVDGDGDLDLVVGGGDGTLAYFETTGTATHPVYVQQTGAADPFDGIDAGDDSTPALGDMDGDGKLDLVVGNSDGDTLEYFKNTGTTTSPVLVQQTGAANPFNDAASDGASPGLGDVDGDGDLDLVVGESDGTLLYFRNDAVLGGTDGDDTLVVQATPGGAAGDVTYVLNGEPPVALSSVPSFTFSGGQGNDTLTVNLANGAPLVGSPIAFDGGAGANTLDLDAAGLPVHVSPGGFTAAGQAVTFSAATAVHVNNAAAVNAGAGPDTIDRATALAGLSAQERFVQALYLAELGRAGTQAELDSWVNGVLTAPGGSQQAVAAGIAGSPEAEGHLVDSWYRAFLGRPANSAEEQGWVKPLQAGQSEEQVLSQILGDAGHEFYGRAQALGLAGTPDQNYVQALYQALLGRSANSNELAGWGKALAAVDRQGVALAILQSQEFRTDQVDANYAALLHRPADAGLGGWVASGLDLHALRVGFESGTEFFTNG
jgi:hypothetical protein